jgi:hypothetical protein
MGGGIYSILLIECGAGWLYPDMYWVSVCFDPSEIHRGVVYIR